MSKKIVVILIIFILLNVNPIVTSFSTNMFKLPSPSGPDIGEVGVEYRFSVNLSTGPENEFFIVWSWGDGNSSGWFGPLTRDSIAYASYTWSKTDVYPIQVRIKDENGTLSEWSEPLNITIVPHQLRVDIIGKIGRILVKITNVGGGDVLNLDYSLDVYCGWHKKIDGNIQIFGPGDSVMLSGGLIFGLGNLRVEVSTDSPNTNNISKVKTGFLFFVIPIFR